MLAFASETFNTDVDLNGIELEVLFIPNAFTRLNFVGAINNSEIVGYLDYDPRNPYGVGATMGSQGCWWNSYGYDRRGSDL